MLDYRRRRLLVRIRTALTVLLVGGALARFAISLAENGVFERLFGGSSEVAPETPPTPRAR